MCVSVCFLVVKDSGSQRRGKEEVDKEDAVGDDAAPDGRCGTYAAVFNEFFVSHERRCDCTQSSRERRSASLEQA